MAYRFNDIYPMPNVVVVMMQFELDRVAAVEAIPEFLELYAMRPIANNSGGMGFNHSFGLWFILKKLNPSLIVESGVWKGHSTWVIEQACPSAKIVCLDLNFDRVVYRSPRAEYHLSDFSEVDWSGFDLSRAVGFFDDHQNAYARLKELWWMGFRHAIFEDNYPCGEGDCYSLKHVFSGIGHPRLQMSKLYQSKFWIKDRIQRARERLIASLGARQQLIVRPNAVDRANLSRRLNSYCEFPPVLLGERSSWGADWTKDCAALQPLLDGSDQARSDAIRALDANLFYCYLSYVSLKS